jgi:hypothetical protein
MTPTVEVWSGVEGLDGNFSFASKIFGPLFMGSIHSTPSTLSTLLFPKNKEIER